MKIASMVVYINDLNSGVMPFSRTEQGRMAFCTLLWEMLDMRPKVGKFEIVLHTELTEHCKEILLGKDIEADSYWWKEPNPGVYSGWADGERYLCTSVRDEIRRNTELAKILSSGKPEYFYVEIVDLNSNEH